jgi:DNA-binding GntR family transcriptional regulator
MDKTSVKRAPDDGNAVLADKAYDYVVKNICEGLFRPDTKISDRKIAQQLKMSHGPVREAMGKLEERGWIVRIPQKGAYVKKYTGQEIEKLYMLREIIEVGCLRFVIDKITDPQQKELERIVELMRSAWQEGNSKGYEEADMLFHQMLVRFTNNERLYKMLDAVIVQSNLVFPIAAVGGLHLFLKLIEQAGFDPEEANTSHKKIFDAIVARDIVLAEELLRAHVRSSFQFIVWTGNLYENMKRHDV